MRILFFLTLGVAVLLLYSNCQGSNERNLKQPKHSVNENDLTLKKLSVDFSLDSFSNIPEEIDGCACYFYLSAQDEKMEKYIFISDFANTAFISIKKRVEKFELREHKENSRIYLYSNGEYSLKVEIAKKENGASETSVMEGSISLSKGNNIIRKDFVGACGC